MALQSVQLSIRTTSIDRAGSSIASGTPLPLKKRSLPTLDLDGSPPGAQDSAAKCHQALAVATLAAHSSNEIEPLNNRRVKRLESVLSRVHSRHLQTHVLIDRLFQHAWLIRSDSSLPTVDGIRFRNLPVASSSLNHASILKLLPGQHALLVWLQSVGLQLMQRGKGRPDLVLHRTYAFMIYYLQLLVYAQRERELGRPSLSTLDSDEKICPSIILPCLEDELSTNLQRRLETFYDEWQACADEKATEDFLQDPTRQKWIYSLLALRISQNRLISSLKKPTKQAFFEEITFHIQTLMRAHTLRGVNQRTFLDHLITLPQALDEDLEDADLTLRQYLQPDALKLLELVSKGKNPYEAMEEFESVFGHASRSLLSDAQALKDQIKKTMAHFAVFEAQELTEQALSHLLCHWNTDQGECSRMLTNAKSIRSKNSQSYALCFLLNESMAVLNASIREPLKDLDPRTQFTAAILDAQEKKKEVEKSIERLEAQYKEIETATDSFKRRRRELEAKISTYQKMIEANRHTLVSHDLREATIVFETVEGKVSLTQEKAYAYMSSLFKELSSLENDLRKAQAFEVSEADKLLAIVQAKEHVIIERKKTEEAFAKACKLQQITLHLSKIKPLIEGFLRVAKDVASNLEEFEKILSSQQSGVQLAASLRKDLQMSEESEWAMVLTLTARIFSQVSTPVLSNQPRVF